MTRWAVSIGLAGVLAFSAFVRFADLEAPGFWLDEILAVTRPEFRSRCPYTGPLYDTIMTAARRFGDTEATYRAPFAAAGVASVGVMYALGATLAAPGAGLLAAALLAGFPAHVYYSREARPYAALVLELLLGFLGIVLMLPGRDRARVGIALLAVAVVLLICTSPHGALLATTLLGSLGLVLLTRRSALTTARLVWWVAGTVATVLASILLYYPLLGCGLGTGIESGRPSLTLDAALRFAKAIAHGTNDAQRSSSIPALVLACAGITYAAGFGCGVVILLKRRSEGAVVLTMALGILLLPMTVLYAFDSWIAVRYVLPGLAAALVIVALGLDIMVASVAELIAKRWDLKSARLSAAVTVMVAGSIVWVTHAPARAAVRGKADWRQVARVVANHAGPQGLVITAGGWGRMCLAYYLPRLGAQVDLRSAQESAEKARQLVAGRERAILVAGGFVNEAEVRQWMRQFPAVFASRQEDISVTVYAREPGHGGH